MKVVGFNLDYENSYQKWSFKITHGFYVFSKSGYEQAHGRKVNVNENVALEFEKLFSPLLKIAYVDIVNAENSELVARAYECKNKALLVHKITWRHMKNRVTFLLTEVERSREIKPKHVDEVEGRKILKSLSIDVR